MGDSKELICELGQDDWGAHTVVVPMLESIQNLLGEILCPIGQELV